MRVPKRERGCGYRKPGGLYITTENIDLSTCCKLPMILTVCPTCSHGIKPSRGWTWVDAVELFSEEPACSRPWQSCMLSGVTDHDLRRVGLLWIGEQYYKTPQDWLNEVKSMGVSRRLPAVPKGIELGKTVVLVAHRKGATVTCDTCNGTKRCEMTDHPEVAEKYRAINGDASIVCPECEGTGIAHEAAVFNAFVPTRFEYIVNFDDDDEKLERIEERGITLVKEYDPQTKVPGTEPWDEE